MAHALVDAHRLQVHLKRVIVSGHCVMGVMAFLHRAQSWNSYGVCYPGVKELVRDCTVRGLLRPLPSTIVNFVRTVGIV